MNLYSGPISGAPLADRIRPNRFDRFFGQERLVGEGRLLRRAIEEDKLASMILWGPPGTGKTTLAKIIASTTERFFAPFSAVTSGIKEARAMMKEAEERLNSTGQRTILFVDEIHRFNRAQQDAFLPFVEQGIITLIGATTENPSFEVNNALLSRCRVYVLESLSDEDIASICRQALADERVGLASFSPRVDDDALLYLINRSNGDARVALNTLELAVMTTALNDQQVRSVNRKIMAEALENRMSLYDKGGEEHYNLISALHKSLRGSDPQAALYWLVRMLFCGEDPMYIARRLVRFASEDIGLADPNALPQTIAARDAYHFLGMPEGDIALAQCVLYLATAPKSNSVYMAAQAARLDVEKTRNDPVPLSIRNAPTRLMKELNYGKGYQYDPDAENGYSGQSYLPEALEGRVWYTPGAYGFEKDIRKRMDYWDRLRKARNPT